MAFEDILWTQGQDNMGGLVGDLYFVPIEDIDFTTPPTLDADGVTISGAITLKALKKWFRIYHTRGTGKIDDNVVGERDGRSFENLCEFKFPGDTKEVIAFKRQVLNTPIALIGRDPQGNYRILGITVIKNQSTSLDELTLDFPAYIESAPGTTGLGSDAKGHTFQVKCEAISPPLFYEGTIDLDAGT